MLPRAASPSPAAGRVVVRSSAFLTVAEPRRTCTGFPVMPVVGTSDEPDTNTPAVAGQEAPSRENTVMRIEDCAVDDSVARCHGTNHNMARARTVVTDAVPSTSVSARETSRLVPAVGSAGSPIQMSVTSAPRLTIGPTRRR